MREVLLGCSVDVLTMAETVELARNAMRTRTRLQHVALNVAKLVNARRDSLLAADIGGSDLIGIDGMGIVWAARLLGLPVKERVSGVDLLTELLAVCAADGFRPYFLGATQDILYSAVRKTEKKHPTLRMAGFRDGYFTPDLKSGVVAEIRNSGADCLFIGMPTPRKERFLAAHRDELNIPFIMGVGGAFDVLSGSIGRAPVRMQGMGLEWLYRVYQEPRRMWWRYAKTNALFAGILAGAMIHRSVLASARLRSVPRANSTRSGG